MSNSDPYDLQYPDIDLGIPAEFDSDDGTRICRLCGKTFRLDADLIGKVSQTSPFCNCMQCFKRIFDEPDSGPTVSEFLENWFPDHR